MRSQELPAKPVSMLDPRKEYIKCEGIRFLCEVSLLVRKDKVPGPPRKENRVLKILCKTLSPMVIQWMSEMRVLTVNMNFIMANRLINLSDIIVKAYVCWLRHLERQVMHIVPCIQTCDLLNCFHDIITLISR